MAGKKANNMLRSAFTFDDRQPCVRAQYHNGPLAHNPPISAITSVLHGDENTVILQSLDVAHAQNNRLFKRFYFKFEETEGAKNFIGVYTYVAPNAQENIICTESEGECDKLSEPIRATNAEGGKGSDGDSLEAKRQNIRFQDQNCADTEIRTSGVATGTGGAASDSTEKSTELHYMLGTVYGEATNDDVKGEKFSTYNDDAC